MARTNIDFVLIAVTMQIGICTQYSFPISKTWFIMLPSDLVLFRYNVKTLQ